MGSMLNIPSRMEGPEQKTIIGKPEITVSAKGIQNGTSVYLNDGADFGPDTKLGATTLGQYGPPFTTTLGLQEANDFLNTSNLTSMMAYGDFTINTVVTLKGNNVIIDMGAANFTHGSNDLFHLNNFNNSRLSIGNIKSNGGNSIVLQYAILNFIDIISMSGSGTGDAIQNSPTANNPTNDNLFKIGIAQKYANIFHQVSPQSGYTGNNQGTVINGTFFNNQDTSVANGILIDSAVGVTYIEFIGVIDMSNTTQTGWKDINESGGGNNLYLMKFINDVQSDSVLKTTSTVINSATVGQLSLLGATPIIFGADQTNPSKIDQETNTLVLRTSTTSNSVDFTWQLINNTNHYTFTPSSISSLFGITTKGKGIGAIYGIDNRTGITTADASPITLYTTTASGQMYKVNARILATAGSAATYVISWTENSVARTSTLTVSATGTQYSNSLLIQPDSGKAITAQITSITSSTVDVGAIVEQVA